MNSSKDESAQHHVKEFKLMTTTIKQQQPKKLYLKYMDHERFGMAIWR